MGYFRKILFKNFRNLLDSTFEFDSSCNVIMGKNGSGKTNILEGLSLFEKGRGFKKEKIHNLINFENKNKGFNIHSFFQNESIKYNVNILSSEKNLKKISVNNSFHKDSVSHFESLFSIIFFLPEMERLFLAPPSLRRNFLDRLIYNQDKNYNLIVNNYKKIISERQLLLKENYFDENWINKLEFNICEFGSIIYKKRIKQIENLNQVLKNINKDINVYSNFVLYIKDEFLEKNQEILSNKDLYLLALKKNRKIDSISGRCIIGPHKSDFGGIDSKNNFNLDQLSTGQQKTVVLLIIISQCIILIDNLNLNPVILLDEVCSHLDSNNRDILLYLIDSLKVQVFMTGTEESFFSFLSTKANYCNIN